MLSVINMTYFQLESYDRSCVGLLEKTFHVHHYWISASVSLERIADRHHLHVELPLQTGNAHSLSS